MVLRMRRMWVVGGSLRAETMDLQRIQSSKMGGLHSSTRYEGGSGSTVQAGHVFSWPDVRHVAVLRCTPSTGKRQR